MVTLRLTGWYFGTELLLSFLCFVPLIYAQISDTERLIQAGILEKTVSYTYPVEGRPDPFKPFVSHRSISSITLDPNEIVDDANIALSGMQLFEPGQLKLVGILMSPECEIALVEDQTQKGYILKVGTLIGKRGVVTSIEPDQVLVEETARTRVGQLIKSTIAMRLNKEREK